MLYYCLEIIHNCSSNMLSVLPLLLRAAPGVCCFEGGCLNYCPAPSPCMRAELVPASFAAASVQSHPHCCVLLLQLRQLLMLHGCLLLLLLLVKL